MEKVKVAIIDTGIDINDKILERYIKFDSNFQISKNKKIQDINDLNGHGTMCAKTILGLCKDVEFYPIKIFDENGITSSLNLIKALDNILDSYIDIINISASTLNSEYKEDLQSICHKLYANGKIIVSSHHKKAGENESYPTFFKSVIGVKGRSTICRDLDYSYDINENIQMNCNSKDCLVEFKDSVTHFGKNSRAAALATGIIASKIKNYGNLTFKELEEILVRDSRIKTRYKKHKILLKKGYKKDLNKKLIAEKIVELINNHFSVKYVSLEIVEKYSIFNNITNIGRHNAYEFLGAINKEFNIKIDYKKIFLYELNNLYLLTDVIKGYLDVSIKESVY